MLEPVRKVAPQGWRDVSHSTARMHIWQKKSLFSSQVPACRQAGHSYYR